jgi:hypothetical protein
VATACTSSAKPLSPGGLDFDPVGGPGPTALAGTTDSGKGTTILGSDPAIDGGCPERGDAKICPATSFGPAWIGCSYTSCETLSSCASCSCVETDSGAAWDCHETGSGQTSQSASCADAGGQCTGGRCQKVGPQSCGPINPGGGSEVCCLDSD